MAEAAEFDVCPIADVSLDTTGLSVVEVVRSLREQVGTPANRYGAVSARTAISDMWCATTSCN